MKNVLAILLRCLIICIGVGSLFLMLWEPHLEGRNVHATTFQVYFHDPFLAYAYLASIAYYTALVQAFGLIGCWQARTLLTVSCVKRLRTIKRCGTALMLAVAGAVAYFAVVRTRDDDIAGGVMLGFLFIVVSAIVTIAASVFERKARRASALHPR